MFTLILNVLYTFLKLHVSNSTECAVLHVFNGSDVPYLQYLYWIVFTDIFIMVLSLLH